MKIIYKTNHNGIYLDLISNRFNFLTEPERQNSGWSFLEKKITPSMLDAVQGIYTYTPEEYEKNLINS